MNINTKDFKKEKKDLYSHLWEKQDLQFNVIRKGGTDPSYEFEFGKKDLITFVGDSLAENFGIKESQELFLKKFKMACSGSGAELQKITTMHSSSLCSLLFFFSVSKEKPLKLNLGGKKYNFTDSFFEFQNKVIGFPSNVDVVLLGENIETNQKVILFLESKFSEFITGINKEEQKFKIGKSYFKKDSFSEPIYKKLFDKKILKKENEGYVFSSKRIYIEGIKQMISHYYGVRNFIDGENYNEEDENQKEVIAYFSKDINCEILLGTILFDNLSEGQKKVYFDSYVENYKKLAEIINEEYETKKTENMVSFRMLENPLIYSEIKDFISDLPIVRHYYFGKEPE